MRIVRVRHLFFPDMPRDYFYELSAQQSKRGHQVGVVTWRKNGGFSEKRVLEGFVIHRLPGLNLGISGLFEEYPYIPNLPTTIEKLKPDVVHAESHLFLTTVQAVRKAKKLGLPCVVTVHGVFAERGFVVNSAQLAYLRTLGLEVFKNADRVICLTQSDVGEIVRLGCSLEKIRLIPNAVDIEWFKPCKERESNLVVWVGRFVPEKGVEYFIEAARIVVDKFKGVRFLLIGYGPLKANVMRLAHERKLDEFVRFAGLLSRGEIAEVLGKAAIFVCPSLKEGMPISVLEAMACGVPVVGSDISGVNDLVKHGESGLLVPPKDSALLAEAVLTLLKDDGLRRVMSANARRTTVEQYSWSKVIERVDDVYCEAVGRFNG